MSVVDAGAEALEEARRRRSSWRRARRPEGRRAEEPACRRERNGGMNSMTSTPLVYLTGGERGRRRAAV